MTVCWCGCFSVDCGTLAAAVVDDLSPERVGFRENQSGSKRAAVHSKSDSFRNRNCSGPPGFVMVLSSYQKLGNVLWKDALT
jgi:hypothetical protein